MTDRYTTRLDEWRADPEAYVRKYDLLAEQMLERDIARRAENLRRDQRQAFWCGLVTGARRGLGLRDKGHTARCPLGEGR